VWFTCYGFVGVLSQSVCLSCWCYCCYRLSGLSGLVGVYRSHLSALLVSVLQNLLSWLLTGTCAYRILIGFLAALWYSRAGSVGDNIGSPAFCQCPWSCGLVGSVLWGIVAFRATSSRCHLLTPLVPMEAT